MTNKDEKEASGVLSSALVNMALYRDPIVALNTSRSDFHIADPMNHEKPLDLYLVVSPADTDRPAAHLLDQGGFNPHWLLTGVGAKYLVPDTERV